MNEQWNDIDFQASPSSGNIDRSVPSYLLEAELDREWERRHRRDQFGKAYRKPAEGEMST